jgi:hypothetical protein
MVDKDAFVEAAAELALEANRLYCKMIGDNSQPNWREATDEQRDSMRQAVELALDGATPQQQHEQWADYKYRHGWVYGKAKNPTTREHPCLVPYDQLPPEHKAKDELCQTVVHALWAAAERSER